MRKFLTGYAIRYNRRHRRHGHLFQNRYKSIVCDEDAYFCELVRYIHLNPLRARLVESLDQLDRYPWCGHAVLLGKTPNTWLDRRYVLSWFGERERNAMRAYREYVEQVFPLVVGRNWWGWVDPVSRWMVASSVKAGQWGNRSN